MRISFSIRQCNRVDALHELSHGESFLSAAPGISAAHGNQSGRSVQLVDGTNQSWFTALHALNRVDA
jgi:hypothetical protein